MLWQDLVGHRVEHAPVDSGNSSARDNTLGNPGTIHYLPNGFQVGHMTFDFDDPRADE